MIFHWSNSGRLLFFIYTSLGKGVDILFTPFFCPPRESMLEEFGAAAPPVLLPRCLVTCDSAQRHAGSYQQTACDAIQHTQLRRPAKNLASPGSK